MLGGDWGGVLHCVAPGHCSHSSNRQQATCVSKPGQLPGEGSPLGLGLTFPGPKESGPAGPLQGQEESELARFPRGPALALVLFLRPGVREPTFLDPCLQGASWLGRP